MIVHDFRDDRELPVLLHLFFDVENGLNICSRSSGGTPGQESSTVTQTPGSSFEISDAMDNRSSRVRLPFVR